MIPLLIAAGAIYLLSLKRDEAQSEKVQIEPTGIKYDKSTKQLTAEITAINPTNKPFKVDSLFMTVFNNGKKLGTIEKFEPFEVTKLGRSTINLPLKISPSGLGQFIADTVITRKPVNIEAKGDLRYKGLSVPISKKVDFKEL
jgi:LEA14-like dessication related protein